MSIKLESQPSNEEKVKIFSIEASKESDLENIDLIFSLLYNKYPYEIGYDNSRKLLIKFKNINFIE